MSSAGGRRRCARPLSTALIETPRTRCRVPHARPRGRKQNPCSFSLAVTPTPARSTTIFFHRGRVRTVQPERCTVYAVQGAAHNLSRAPSPRDAGIDATCRSETSLDCVRVLPECGDITVIQQKGIAQAQMGVVRTKNVPTATGAWNDDPSRSVDLAKQRQRSDQRGVSQNAR
jgi:hypothetical protein